MGKNQLVVGAGRWFPWVPLVVLGDRSGHEIEYPLADVILGGLATSTLLHLFVVPALRLRFGRPRPASPADAPAAVSVAT
jgi:Cu/Ag efflux pump CusA